MINNGGIEERGMSVHDCDYNCSGTDCPAPDRPYETSVCSNGWLSSDRPTDAVVCIVCRGTGALGMPGVTCQWCHGKGWDETATKAARLKDEDGR